MHIYKILCQNVIMSNYNIKKRQVRSIQKKPYDSAAAYTTPPLVVLNNFGQVDQKCLQLFTVLYLIHLLQNPAMLLII